jgi:membrane-bound serine protease (ClpP class)
MQTRDVVIERREMTRRQQFLSAIAHPQIAYLLLSLGMLGLTVELWNPGSVFPGVAGAVCLLLAFFAFQVLPVDTAGLLLVILGLALLVLELKVPSFGVLGVGGTVSLLIGSVMLTNEIPGVRVGLDTLVPLALGIAGVVLFLGRLALKAQRAAPVTGAEGLIGAHGHTLTAVRPGQPGQIRVHGEIWQARSGSAIDAGQAVRITALDGLTATVEPDRPASSEGGQK